MNTAVLAETPATNAAAPAIATPAVTGTVTKVPVSDELVTKFCDAIIDGADTKGIFPDRISNLALTDAQKDSIKAARKDREAHVKADKRNIMKWLRHPRVETRGLKQRTNARNGSETMHLRAVKPGLVRKSK